MLAYLPSPPRGVWLLDVATWAVPVGIIGARFYHVITDPEFYFGSLYESLWDIGVAVLLVWAGRRFGLRLNDWTSLVVFLAAIGFLLLRRPRREQAHNATAARQ